MVELSEELRIFQLMARRYGRNELMPLEARVIRGEPVPPEEQDRVEALG